ncbi:hypothetical protein ACFFRR_009030 [Megaselia abdita]
MNVNRISRILNVFLIVICWKIHWLQWKPPQLRISIVPVVYVVGVFVWYAMCFYQHFESIEILQTIADVSTVISWCIRTHLLLGLKLMILIVFQYRRFARLSNRLLRVPFKGTEKFTLNELIAYLLMFTTVLINFGVGIYDVVKLRHHRMPFINLMLFSALYVPHVALAGCVKYLNTLIWILTCYFTELREEIDKSTDRILSVDENGGTTLTIVENNNANSAKQPILFVERLDTLIIIVNKLNERVQKQLYTLIGLNAICLVFAAYSLVYYNTTWHSITSDAFGSALKVSCISIFVCVLVDYLCLGFCNSRFEREKVLIRNSLKNFVERKSDLKEDEKERVRNVREELRDEAIFKIVWFYKMDFGFFAMLNILTALGIGLFVVFHYFNDMLEDVNLKLS